MTRQDFIQFIENLKTDCIENTEQWKNKTIEDYREVMSRYMKDSDFYEMTN